MDFEKGQILSETSFYEVTKVTSKGINVLLQNGKEAGIDINYANANFKSAHNVNKEVKVTKTELADKFIASIGIACTVNFNKQVKKEDVVAELLDIIENTSPNKLKLVLGKNVEKTLEGESRTMIGIHYGNITTLGRIQFTDMKIKTGHNQRQVDPRTINWLIVDNIKYLIK